MFSSFYHNKIIKSKIRNKDNKTKNKKSLTVTLYGRLWTIVLILGYGVYSLILDPMLMMGAVEY
jgi:hypothetical protein